MKTMMARKYYNKLDDFRDKKRDREIRRFVVPGKSPFKDFFLHERRRLSTLEVCAWNNNSPSNSCYCYTTVADRL